MKSFKISPITKDIVVSFNVKNVRLSESVQKSVDAYWEVLLASGKSYKRGEVFTVTHKDTTDGAINVLVEKTDYAHYLYCQNVESLGENGVHIIHTAALVETRDGYFVFGEMGHHTSRSGIYQLCGGGIDNDDLRGDRFDFTHNISKELLEELNIDVMDTSRVSVFCECYFKEGGPTDKMTVIYKVVLNEMVEVFLEKYRQFVKQLKEQGELPEFEKIVILKKDKGSIKKFFERSDVVFDEYMKPLFAYIETEMK